VNRTLIMFGIMIVFLFSCDEDKLSETEQNCFAKHYYYEQTEKVNISSNILDNYVFIGFYKSTLNSEISTFIENEESLDSNFEYEIRESNNQSYKMVLCKYTTKLNCIKIENKIEQFCSKEIVAFSSYVYDCDMIFGGVQYDNMTYSDEFMVKIESSNSLDELNLVAEQTNTVIKSQVYLMPEWYILSSNKNSNGDALEMANFFFETGKFKNAVPDFIRIEIE
jgi:hypothetical protein